MFLQTSSHVWLTGRQRGSRATSTPAAVCHDRKHMRKTASHWHIIRKGRNSLPAFSGNYGQSSSLLYQRMTGNSCLKVSYRVESETLSVTFFWVYLAGCLRQRCPGWSWTPELKPSSSLFLRVAGTTGHTTMPGLSPNVNFVTSSMVTGGY